MKIPSQTLVGKAVVLDWSDAQVKGLKAAIGDFQTTTLIKGCKVHWLRSCQCVADKVASGIEVLCNMRSLILKKMPHLCKAEGLVKCQVLGAELLI
jgi:hypothetical protein